MATVRQINSVGLRLLLAFMAIAALSVGAAMVGWYSYNIIKSSQDRIIDDTVPAAQDALALAEGSAYLVALTSTLEQVDSFTELQIQADLLNQQGQYLQDLLVDLESHRFALNEVAELRKNVPTLLDHLSQIGQLLARRIEHTQHQVEHAEQITAVLINISAELEPLIINGYAKLHDGIDALSILLNADLAHQQTAANESLTQLQLNDVDLGQHIELSFHSKTLTYAINRLAQETDPQQVANIYDDFKLQLRSMARITAAIKPAQMRLTMAGFLQTLVQQLKNENNLFTQRIAVLQTQEQINRLNKLNRNIVTNLSAKVSTLVATATAATDHAFDQAQQTLQFSRVLLTVLAIAATVISLSILWFYVYKRIIRRLTDLSARTLRLSAGELDIEIEREGHDEIAQMATALQGFRDNARQLRQQEQLLQVQNRELLATNQQLDQFTHAAAHDLQEPLRKTLMFSQLLEMNLGEHKSKDIQNHLDQIMASTQQMQALVQALLDFSRADKSELNLKLAALDRCVDMALDALLVRLDTSAAVIERDQLPSLTVDRLFVTQLYQNLISNALKFVEPGTQPNIRLTAEQEHGSWVLGVRDNGIGIESKYNEHIFMPFKRLHRRDDYDGSGIGLATCQKIVQRHGGKLWVESELGKGAHFKFTLAPASAKAA